MELIVAKNAGFCPGVRRAVDTVYRLIDENPGARIVTLGELIHNPIVTGELAARGVKSVSDGDLEAMLSRDSDIPLIAVVRAHGMTRETEELLERLTKENGCFSYVDCTCPFVKNIHRIAEEESRPYADRPHDAIGIIFGDPDHPEVKGIRSRFRCDTKILATADETERWISTDEAQKILKKRVIYVSQTTQKLAECKISQKFI